MSDVRESEGSMEVTEVRISRRTQGDAKLKGYAAVTFDDVFVVRDLKIIEGKKGLFVAMPSQKVFESCPHCKKKNPVRSRFCNECGQKQPQKNGAKKEIHRDIAHPVNSDMRTYLQKVIIEAFNANQDGANQDASEASQDGATYQDGGDSGGDFDGSDDELSGGKEASSMTPDDYLSRPSLKESERVTKEEDLKQALLNTIE